MTVKQESVRFVLDALLWAWNKRAFLWGRLEKYTKLERGSPIKFDGESVERAIIKYEPVVWSVVSGGSSIAGAVIRTVVREFGPVKLSPEEEKERMNRPDIPG